MEIFEDVIKVMIVSKDDINQDILQYKNFNQLTLADLKSEVKAKAYECKLVILKITHHNDIVLKNRLF